MAGEKISEARIKYLDTMYRLYVGESNAGIPVGIGKDLAAEPVKGSIPQNSINGYRTILAEANSTGSRTLQAKIKPFAESAVRFIQYLTTQKGYMENLTPEAAKTVISYSDPSVLNSPMKQRVPPKDPTKK